VALYGATGKARAEMGAARYRDVPLAGMAMVEAAARADLAAARAQLKAAERFAARDAGR
jgi:hypothetical protein